MAALSLTSMLLPSALAWFGVTDQFWARLSLSGYAAHTILVWAAGGWWIGRRPGLKFPGPAMCLLGVGSGLALGGLGFGWQLPPVAIATVTAGFYGLTVGLLVGYLLVPPAH